METYSTKSVKDTKFNNLPGKGEQSSQQPKKSELKVISLERAYIHNWYQKMARQFPDLFSSRLDELSRISQMAPVHRSYLLNNHAGAALVHNLSPNHLASIHKETLGRFRILTNPSPKIITTEHGTTGLTFSTERTFFGGLTLQGKSMVEIINPLITLVHNPGGVFLFFKVIPLNEQQCIFDVSVLVPSIQPSSHTSEAEKKLCILKAHAEASRLLLGLLNKPLTEITDKSVAEDIKFFQMLSKNNGWRNFLIPNNSSKKPIFSHPSNALFNEYQKQYGGYLDDILEFVYKHNPKT